MTAIVGVLCNDGIVIGADSSVTFSQGLYNRTIEQPAEKISIIGNHIILVGTGQVGLGQRFEKIVQDAWNNNHFKGNKIDCAKKLTATILKDFAETNVPKDQIGQWQYAALLAFHIAGEIHLCEFALADLQPEFKTETMWYCSMGSAQPITDTLLAFMRDIFWQDGLPGIGGGIFAVLWTLEMAIQINPGGVNGPVRIAIMSGNKGNVNARILTDLDLSEHYQAIAEMKTLMREIRNPSTNADASKSIPPFKP